MSDYGTGLIVLRCDGVSSDSEDDRYVEGVVREELGTLKFADQRGEEPECRIGRHYGAGSEGIFVTITRYWLEEEEVPDPNVVLAREGPRINELASRVQLRLAGRYDVEPVCSHW